MTVYEICAIGITIFLGVIAVELVLTLRAARQLTEEARRTLADVNHRLPKLLEDVQVVTQTVRDTSEIVGGKVGQVAIGMGKIKLNTLRSLAGVLGVAREGLGIWQNIRKRRKTSQ